MTNKAFPTPDEMRDMLTDHHEMTFSLMVPQVDIENILALAVVGMQFECPEGDFACETCNKANAVWWDLCNNLSQRNRVRLQKSIADAGLKLPAAPWEETPF